MLRTVAPRLWEAGHVNIEVILKNDVRLHPPFKIPNHTPSQPTAFGEVQYRFAVTDSVPRTSARATAGVAGWDAFTSLGFYDGRDIGLILWEDRTLVTFPPGSTFFIPAGLLNYSFTAVPDGDMMLLTQTLHNDLYDYVANRFCANPDNLPATWTKEERDAHRRRRAEQVLSRFPTIHEFDANLEIGASVE